MSLLSVSKDIVPIGQFKTGLAGWFKSVRESGRPLIITQNGKPAGVLLSPSEFDELAYKKAFFDSVQRGVTDVEAGRTLSAEDLKIELKKRRKQE
jgi:antitoxin YefM